MRVRGVWRGVFMVVALTLAGCGGAVSPTNTPVIPTAAPPTSTPAATVSGDPIVTVKDFIADLKGGNFDKLPALFCPAFQSAIRAWDGTDLIRAQLPEISLEQAHSAMDVTANLFANSPQGSGATAQVHLTGNIAAAPNAKARDLVKAHLVAQGSPSDSSAVDTWMAGAANLTEGRSVDDQLLMTYDSGTWLICGDTNHFTHG